jgi:DNA-binding Lrp family transcriptional regulator
MVAKDAKTVTGSYALITIGDHEKRMAAIGRLCPMTEVIRCDAVDGDYSLILLMRGAASDEVADFVDSKVRTIDGVEGVDICEVELVVEHDGQNLQPAEGISAADAPAAAESYAFLEIDKDCFEEVFEQIDALESVVASEVARGPYSLVVRLCGSEFDQLDRVVDNKLRALDGVLRVRQSRIIKKSEM